MVYKNVKVLEINTVLMHQATNLVWRKLPVCQGFRVKNNWIVRNLPKENKKENKIQLIFYIYSKSRFGFIKAA